MKYNVSSSVHQFLHAPSDSDYLDQLITTIKDATASGRELQLTEELERFSDEREKEIERLCNNNHQDFVSSVQQLLTVRKGTVDLTDEILKLNASIQTSTQRVVEHKKALVDSRDVRQNIDEATQSLRLCLEVLGLANRVSDLLKAKKHYSALRTLDELQNVHLKEVVQFDVADMIQRSVPAMQGMVKEAVMSELNQWLFNIREKTQSLGQLAFDQTELRRRRQKERIEKAPYLKQFKLNSAIELVLDEREEFDVLVHADIDFTPLFECLHIHTTLGERDEFRVTYADVRRQQKELLMPASITFTNDDISSLNHLLEGIAGFSLLEKATMRKTGNFRSSADVDELWDSMCKKAIAIITPALSAVTVAETLLKVKNIIALFIQTMDSFGYPVDHWDSFLLPLFSQYSTLLKREFSADFRDIVSNDDYDPMTISSLEEYEKVASVSWIREEKPPEELTFPMSLPFSQMYPLCCADIRHFLNRYYFFSDEHFTYQSVVDEELKSALDELLTTQVCQTLVQKLDTHYLGQIVRILINLEYFEYACRQLERLLLDARQSNQGGGIGLKATEAFLSEKKTAEKRIFEVVNSKIDDLVETAEYNWTTTAPPPNTPSTYVQELTLFLSQIMSSTLVDLPHDIKGLIYFDALGHLASSILSLPLSENVKKISPSALASLDTDVTYLRTFVSSLNDPMLQQIFEELRQTVDLMKSADNADEFYAIDTRMKKYANVDPLNGPRLLEKVGAWGETEKPKTGLSRFRS